MIQLLLEAIIVGFVLVIISYVVVFLISKFYSHNLPKICKKWNKDLKIFLFFIGVFTHFLFEFTGLNKWYCRNGYACKK